MEPDPDMRRQSEGTREEALPLATLARIARRKLCDSTTEGKVATNWFADYSDSCVRGASCDGDRASAGSCTTVDKFNMTNQSVKRGQVRTALGVPAMSPSKEDGVRVRREEYPRDAQVISRVDARCDSARIADSSNRMNDRRNRFCSAEEQSSKMCSRSPSKGSTYSSSSNNSSNSSSNRAGMSRINPTEANSISSRESKSVVGERVCEWQEHVEASYSKSDSIARCLPPVETSDRAASRTKPELDDHGDRPFADRSRRAIPGGEQQCFREQEDNKPKERHSSTSGCNSNALCLETVSPSKTVDYGSPSSPLPRLDEGRGRNSLSLRTPSSGCPKDSRDVLSASAENVPRLPPKSRWLMLQVPEPSANARSSSDRHASPSSASSPLPGYPSVEESVTGVLSSWRRSPSGGSSTESDDTVQVSKVRISEAARGQPAPKRRMRSPTRAPATEERPLELERCGVATTFLRSPAPRATQDLNAGDSRQEGERGPFYSHNSRLAGEALEAEQGKTMRVVVKREGTAEALVQERFPNNVSYGRSGPAGMPNGEQLSILVEARASQRDGNEANKVGSQQQQQQQQEEEEQQEQRETDFPRHPPLEKSDPEGVRRSDAGNSGIPGRLQLGHDRQASSSPSPSPSPLSSSDAGFKSAVERAAAAVAALPEAAEAAAATTDTLQGKPMGEDETTGEPIVDVLCSPAGKTTYVLKSGPPRRGKWSPLEEEYARRIIRDFEEGLLDVEPGTGLRQFLAAKLRCEGMRISKKFCGVAAVGKRAFRPAPDPGCCAAMARASLFTLEQRWLKTFTRCRVVNTSPDMTSNSPSPPSPQESPMGFPSVSAAVPPGAAMPRGSPAEHRDCNSAAGTPKKQIMDNSPKWLTRPEHTFLEKPPRGAVADSRSLMAHPMRHRNGIYYGDSVDKFAGSSAAVSSSNKREEHARGPSFWQREGHSVASLEPSRRARGPSSHGERPPCLDDGRQAWMGPAHRPPAASKTEKGFEQSRHEGGGFGFDRGDGYSSTNNSTSNNDNSDSAIKCGDEKGLSWEQSAFGNHSPSLQRSQGQSRQFQEERGRRWCMSTPQGKDPRRKQQGDELSEALFPIYSKNYTYAEDGRPAWTENGKRMTRRAVEEEKGVQIPGSRRFLTKQSGTGERGDQCVARRHSSSTARIVDSAAPELSHAKRGDSIDHWSREGGSVSLDRLATIASRSRESSAGYQYPGDIWVQREPEAERSKVVNERDHAPRGDRSFEGFAEDGGNPSRVIKGGRTDRRSSRVTPFRLGNRAALPAYLRLDSRGSHFFPGHVRPTVRTGCARGNPSANNPSPESGSSELPRNENACFIKLQPPEEVMPEPGKGLKSNNRVKPQFGSLDLATQPVAKDSAVSPKTQDDAHAAAAEGARWRVGVRRPRDEDERDWTRAVRRPLEVE